MNARFYVPGLGRFLSADTIVPDPANPQSFNRYSYVLNSPLKFTDPTGHCAEGSWGDDYEDAGCLQIAQEVANTYGYSFNSLSKYNWGLGDELIADGENIGGNEYIGFNQVEVNGRKVTVDGYNVFSLNFGDDTLQKRTLVMQRGETGTRLSDFMSAANLHDNAQDDFNFGAAAIKAGTISSLAGLGTFVLTASIPEPTVSKGIAVLASIETVGGLTSIGVGITELLNARDDIYTYSRNAEAAFNDLTSNTLYAKYTLAVDLAEK